MTFLELLAQRAIAISDPDSLPDYQCGRDWEALAHLVEVAYDESSCPLTDADLADVVAALVVESCPIQQCAFPDEECDAEATHRACAACDGDRAPVCAAHLRCHTAGIPGACSIAVQEAAPALVPDSAVPSSWWAS